MEYSPKEAKEKLELVLTSLGVDKIVESGYNENEYIDQEVSANIGKPTNNTVFAIGTNPSGSTPTKQQCANIEVYSVRIYSRALTEEEMKLDYEINKKRFEI